MRKESFSFRLRVIDTHEDLLRACAVRAEAYGHKVPAARDHMLVPDAIDASSTTTVFLCEDKTSGEPVGTIRIQTRVGDRGELEMERYVTLPPFLREASRAEVTRLAAPLGVDPFVRLALWKAVYMFAANMGIGWIVMTVRKPSLLKAYRQMGSRDVFPHMADGFVLPYVGLRPHRIHVLDIAHYYDYWLNTRHPLLGFMANTLHEDIAVPQPSVNRQPPELARIRVFQ